MDSNSGDNKGECYDYVIIGGGTAGLTIAARLTEDANVTVAILEAGETRLDDPKIQIPALMNKLYGDKKYDWNFTTTPQTHMNNRTMAWPRGRVLGGSSAVNFLMAANPSKIDVDNWEALGNPGWNWEALQPYFEKSETFNNPDEKTAKELGTHIMDPEIRGKGGPIQQSFPRGTGLVDQAWGRTFETLGLGPKEDPRGKAVLGGYSLPKFMDRNGKRSYAANAYYEPNANRENLRLFERAFVEKIELQKRGDDVVAVGVWFEKQGSRRFLRARREVILSAGTVQSPQILELSGIGSKERLEALGIKWMVDNRNVGENLQDHPLLGIAYEANDRVPTAEMLKQPGVMEWAMNEYSTNAGGSLAGGVTGTAFISHTSLTSSAQQAEVAGLALVKGSSSRQISSKQLMLQQALLLSEEEADIQFNFGATGINPQASNDHSKLFTHGDEGGFVGIVSVLTHAFSRGSIHTISKDPQVYPEINPNYFSHPFDHYLLTLALLYTQTIASTSPLSNLLKSDANGHKIVQPSFGIPNNFSREVASEVVKAGTITSWHPVGTCSMLPREEGGVVDTRLRIYGVKGLRIVDASVFPILGRGNIASLVFAVAERAADMIKEDYA